MAWDALTMPRARASGAGRVGAGGLGDGAQHPAPRMQMMNLQGKSWYFSRLPAAKGTSRPSASREYPVAAPRAPAAPSPTALPVGTACAAPRVPPRWSSSCHQAPAPRPRRLFLLPDNSAIWWPALHRRPSLTGRKEHFRTQDPEQSDLFFLITEPNSDAHIKFNSKALKSLRVPFKKQLGRARARTKHPSADVCVETESSFTRGTGKSTTNCTSPRPKLVVSFFLSRFSDVCTTI